MFELVLKNGLVVDGSGRERFPADVAVVGGRVAKVGPRLEGREEVDCRGHVVAPGFIDTHSHSDLRVLAEPLLPMKVRQGITLEVFGQDGISIAPVKEEDRRAQRARLAGLLGDFGVEWTWRSVREYLDRVSAAQPGPDVAYLVPHGALRQHAMGADDRKAKPDELVEMQRLLRVALAEGACGLSTGLIYPPCCYAPTEELVALGKVLALTQAPLVVHMRSESDRILEAVEEMLQVGEQARCPIHISHLKLAGRDNWPRAEELVALLNGARERRVSLTADQYPYVAGSTLLGAILPPWAHEGGLEATLQRLADAPARERMRAAMADPAPSDWDNFWKWSGPEGIVVADVPSGRRPQWLGRHLAELARETGKDPFDTAFDLLREERLGVAMVSFSQDETVVERFLKLPFVNVCTDGLLGGRPHPRAYGSYPRVLGRYVRERGTLTLEEAVRKMTSQAALAFGFLGLGLVRESYRASLVVFDPDRVVDRATFEEPTLLPEGIRDVLVGGAFVVRDGALAASGVGRVVR